MFGATAAVGCLGYVVWRAAQQWDTIVASGYRPGWLMLAAIPCVTSGQFLMGTCTWLIMWQRGLRPRWSVVMRIHLSAQLVKYLPIGGLLNLATQGVALSQLDSVGGLRGGAAIAAMMGVQCTAALTCFGLVQLMVGDVSAWLAVVAVAALPMFLFILARPDWLPLPAILRRRLPTGAGATLPFGQVVRLGLLGLGVWLAFGACIVILAGEMVTLTPTLALNLTGMFAIAWLAGVLAMIVPAGLGVRDLGFVFLLGGVVPEPWSALLPVVARLVWTAADILGFVIAQTVLPRLSRAQLETQNSA